MTEGKKGSGGRASFAAAGAAGLAGLILLGGALAMPVAAQEAPPVPAAAEDTPAASAADTAAAKAPAADAAESGMAESETAGQNSAAGAAAGTEERMAADAASEGPAEPAASEPAASAPAAGESATSEPAEPPAPKGPLVVVSWGGVYSKSQAEAIYQPFTRSTGIAVSSKVYAGNLDQIREQIASGEVTWDVVDVDPAEAEIGCEEGLFEKLSFILPASPDGTPADEDFLPGTVHPCGVGSVAWSMVLAYSHSEEEGREADAHPESLEDFFDLTTFPGGRGLRRSPMANLEWALLADGVDPAEVYDLLRTDAGVDRAFAKLDTIRDAIIWWEDASEPAQLLSSGDVVMTSTYNAPIFNDIAVRQQPFGVIWDRQLWDIDLWAIPSNAPHREAAVKFLLFATSTQPLARQTRWIPYGPVRRSSAPLVGDFVYADVDMAAYLPTTPGNLETALRNDALFWREEGPALVERFNAWLTR